MPAAYVNLVIGILILLISTNFFVSYAQKISNSLKLSPLIVGITVVSIGTSLPEFSLSLIAAIKGDTGLALGNIIGSNIINILMVLPVAIFFGKLRIGTTKTQRSVILLIAATILYIIISFSKYSSPLSALFLLIGAAAFTFAEYVWGFQGRNKEDKQRFVHKTRISLHPFSVIFQLLSTLGIIAGGAMTVIAVEEISVLLNISTTILGLSITAIATSLPEMITTIITEQNHDEKMTIGNIIGSNIYNLLLVGGVIMFFSKSVTLPIWEWIFLIFSTVFCAIIVFYYKGKTVDKLIGIILLSVLILYFISLQII